MNDAVDVSTLLQYMCLMASVILSGRASCCALQHTSHARQWADLLLLDGCTRHASVHQQDGILMSGDKRFAADVPPAVACFDQSSGGGIPPQHAVQHCQTRRSGFSCHDSTNTNTAHSTQKSGHLEDNCSHPEHAEACQTLKPHTSH